jgi:hypothetical protein
MNFNANSATTNLRNWCSILPKKSPVPNAKARKFSGSCPRLPSPWVGSLRARQVLPVARVRHPVAPVAAPNKTIRNNGMLEYWNDGKTLFFISHVSHSSFH